MSKRKKILVTPLDWGLGHTTRCIPIIKYLLQSNVEVILAGSSASIQLLSEEFPSIKFVEIPGYSIRYAKYKWQLPLVIGLQIPSVINRIKQENKWLQSFVKLEKIDGIISDNRYGMYHNIIPSVFMTHQVVIQVPQSKYIQNLLNKVNQCFIHRFNACWVVDYEGDGLAGDLSVSVDLRHKEFLGNLSRFKKSNDQSKIWDILCIISGPEPQRTIFEHKIFETFKDSNLTILVVRGLPQSKDNLKINKLHIQNHLKANELSKAIEQSELIICRAGYSSIMDMVKLGKHAIIVPTPGQTEQEYLANFLAEKNWMKALNQEDLNQENITSIGKEFNTYPSWNLEQYEVVVMQWLETILPRD